MKPAGSFIATLFLLFAFGAHADSSVWKISKQGQHLFIGGTAHVLSAEDYPLPEEFEQAYSVSEKLVFEVDIEQMADPQSQAAFAPMLVYDEGDLSTRLEPETLDRLKRYLESRNIPLQTVLPLKAGMATILLTIGEMSRIGMSTKGVDEYFNARGRKDHKSMVALETVGQQIQMLANLGKGHEDELIRQTLESFEQFDGLVASIKTAWRCGDRAGLRNSGLADMQRDPQMYQTMLVQRNHAWLPQIEKFLDTDEVEFVLVGVLHLVGDDGLLTLLEAQGYDVEQL
ncbi:MAG: TraB/GumN family protein [Gammaproteobacteria bacterium]|nr:MAG: TraB/GumN family protein [Gammaproteobacteria bacterium]